MSATNTAHGAPTAPQIWSCNWNWCSETFRQGSELAKHVAEAHFKHILQVKEREWDLYLRSSKGQSGATESLIPKVTPSPPPTSSRPVPPLPRNLSRKRPSPTSTDDTTSPPKNPPVIPRTSLFRSHPNSVSPNPVNSQHAASSDESPPSPKRRRKSFATCAAQSSPMSTPSLPSVPPSPALSNMITDAINAAGRLNSLSPSKRLVKLSESAGDVHSQSASATSGYPRPLPRRTTLGASPSPSGPPKLSHTTSFASAQAIEDALTQNLSPAASPTSDAKERALSSSLQYPSQENSEDSKPGSQQPSPEHDSAAYTAHGSHAVSSAPQLSSTYDAEPSTHSSHNPSPARPPSPEHPSPSQSQPSPPIKVIPPLPRRKRAPFAAVPASQPPPATRILRSRSKTPAPAPPVQSQTLQLPRRTTRSRASSATTATVHATAPVGAGKVTVEDVKPKRARSKPPSEGGKAGKGRSRSRSQSRAPSAASASKTRTNHGGSLPAVDELSDDEREGKPDPAVLDTTSPACPPDPYAHLNQKGPYSGTLYIPVPSQLSPSQSAGIDKEIKRELIETGVNEPSSQPLHQSPQFASQSQSSSQLQSSQAGSGSGSGYVEGYGFDMGSLVLQTQAPYQWSQSQ